MGADCSGGSPAAGGRWGAVPVFGYLLPCPAALALFVDALAFGFAEVPDQEQWQQQQCGKPDGGGGDHGCEYALGVRRCASRVHNGTKSGGKQALSGLETIWKEGGLHAGYLHGAK